MKPLVLAWLLAALIFLSMDAAWLGVMGPRLYRPELGSLLRESFDVVPALMFYPLYVSGMLCLAIAPALKERSALAAGVRGALLGLVAYGAYDLTNQATLRDWSWRVTLADLAWGCVATAAASSLACGTTLAVLRRLRGKHQQ